MEEGHKRKYYSRGDYKAYQEGYAKIDWDNDSGHKKDPTVDAVKLEDAPIIDQEENDIEPQKADLSRNSLLADIAKKLAAHAENLANQHKCVQRYKHS